MTKSFKNGREAGFSAGNYMLRGNVLVVVHCFDANWTI